MHRRVLISGVVSLGLAFMLATSALATGGAPRVATMIGANEVPGPGDPDGSGTITVTLNVGQATVCWDYTVTNIALPVTGAHIHSAPAGVAGPVVVPFRAADGSWPTSGCRAADPTLIQAIIDFPEAYYTNVHNAEFPGGAIRGQLTNRGQAD
jgi:CHRD domain